MTLPIALSSASISPSSRSPVSPIMSQSEKQQAITTTTPSSPQRPQQDQSNTNNLAATGANNNNANANVQVKRKPSRRANTAERRATHNAVERQRRETLNGRFLDLAALLPNLSQIRRPSKSSIVNSSIAHIHASRRHRMLASRELRLLKMEADALRRELNDWRGHGGLPPTDEPVRSEAFSMVISAELEALTGVQAEEEEEDMCLGGYDGEEDVYPLGQIIPPGSGMMPVGLESMEDTRITVLKNEASFPHGVPAQQQQQNHHVHNSGNGLPLGHMLSRLANATGAAAPIIASPTAVSFENPALAMYDGHSYTGAPFVQMQQSHSIPSLESDKIAAWNAAQLFNSQHQSTAQMMQQRSAFMTPPSSSHSVSSGSPTHSSTSGSVSPQPHTSSPISANFNEVGFFGMQRAQQQALAHLDYGSPSERDDAVSVGSNHSHGGERDTHEQQQYRQNNSMGPALSSVRGGINVSMPSSHGLSPPFELGPGSHADYPRRIWARDGNMAMGGINVGMGIGVGVGMNAVAVGGGGGNGSGFAMMMM